MERGIAPSNIIQRKSQASGQDWATFTTNALAEFVHTQSGVMAALMSMIAADGYLPIWLIMAAAGWP